MAKTPRVYTRLTRPSAGVGSYKSLWLAADHLLIVNSTGYTEDYARILFRDIKGFFVVDSGRRLAWGLTFGVLTAIAAIPLVWVIVSKETPLISPFFVGLGVIALVWNQWLGGGCKVFIVTGVQTMRLPSIVRWKRARKVLVKLEPLILEAQAGLAPPVIAPAEPPPAPPLAPPPVL